MIFLRIFAKQSYIIVLTILSFPGIKKTPTMIDVSELVDNDFLRQFELKMDNHLAKIEYSLQERKIFLTKLVIPDEIDNEEFTKEFLIAVFSQIEERNLSVVPTSPIIAKFVRSNRKYKRMLPVGLRL
jgi:hypothetical protein